MADLGKRVLLIDANFSSPHLGFHIGLYNPELTLHHVLSGKVNIKEAIYETGYGFDILPGAGSYGKINPFKLFDKLRDIRRKYDVVLIDSSPNLNEEMLATMIASDELLVVTTPDLVTLSSTIKAVKLAKDRRTPIAGIILNKVYGKNFELGIDKIEEASGANVLAVLPHDVSVLESLSKSIPFPTTSKSETAVEYRKLAAALVGGDYKDKRFGSFLTKIFGMVPKQEVNREILKQELLKRY